MYEYENLVRKHACYVYVEVYTTSEFNLYVEGGNTSVVSLALKLHADARTKLR